MPKARARHSRANIEEVAIIREAFTEDEFEEGLDLDSGPEDPAELARGKGSSPRVERAVHPDGGLSAIGVQGTDVREFFWFLSSGLASRAATIA